mgnify:FL=1
MTANVLSLVALIAIILVRVINLKDSTKKQETDKTIDNFIDKHYKKILLVFLLLIFITRIYKFGEIPNFIGVDEAGAAYDAYCLSEYGVDRYLNSFPLYLINFGGGQSALYAYATIPFIKLIGANIIAYRLPELLFFLMGIVVCYILANKMKDKKIALLYTFLIIICPWNIEASRQGLDCNLLAPMFMLDVLLLVTANKNWHYIVAGLAIGMTLYTYCLAWILIPVFLLIYIIYMLWVNKINFKQVILLGIPIALLATPLIYLILLNKGYVTRTNFGIFTIPKLFFFRQGEISINNLLQYGGYSLKTIFTDSRGIYLIELPFLLVGIVVGIKEFIKSIKEKEFSFTGFMTVVFIILLICNLLVVAGTLNRANILYLPMLYLITIGISYLSKDSKWTIMSILVILTALFVAFEVSYYNENLEQRRTRRYEDIELYQITEKLENDENLKNIAKHFIITNKAEPYIFTMLATKPSPYDLKFLYEQKVKQYGNYFFEYDKLLIEDITKEKTIVVVTKGREDIVESLENLNFSKEETNLYCIMKNF